MDEYVIHPWDIERHPVDIEPDMYVPPEVDEIAQAVMGNYEMTVYKKILITTKPDKGGAIWKIETDKGTRSLKLLHRKPARSLFSVAAQDYVVKNGARVPELKKTKENALYVKKGGKLWIVTDWIESLTPAAKNLEGACALCYGLGEFHKHTKGFIPPEGAQRASRLFGWPAYYQKILRKMDWFRNVAKAFEDIPASRSFLSLLDLFENQAVNALTRLEQSSYAQMISSGEEHWGLVHQDYGWSNGQLGPGGLWVIDLDGVAYDLPVRDLRKLISGTMDDMGCWDIHWIQSMIDAYHQANPIDLETYEVLINDLAFPNEFYKQMNDLLYEPVSFLTNEIEQVLQHLSLLEETKNIALTELSLDKTKFATGNYASKPMIKPESLEMIQQKAIIEETPELKNDVVNFPLYKRSGDKLKVLMICTEKLPVPAVRGGAIQTYIDGISEMLSIHHDLTILGTSDPSLPVEEYCNNIHYVRIEGEQIFELYAKKVIEFLQEHHYDLIHVFNRPRLVPYILKIAPFSRLILSMHNDMFGPNKIRAKDAVTAIKALDRIVTVSNYVGKTICDLYPEAASKLKTIYSGVNLDKFTSSSPAAAQTRQRLRKEHKLETKKVILFVGRLTEKKGIDLLIHALNKLYQSNPDLALVIVGGTWYSEDDLTDYAAYVRTLSEKAPFPIVLTGYVSADQIQQWFWAADIFVCPSKWQEPLARVHYEAMAAGLPFVTTARGGNPEVVIEQNGLVVDRPEDPCEFADKLRILLADEKLRKKMGETGRRLAERRFTWQRVAEDVLTVWKEVVNEIPAVGYANSPMDSSVKPKLSKPKKKSKKGLPEKSHKEVAKDPKKSTVKGSSVVKITRDMIHYPE